MENPIAYLNNLQQIITKIINTQMIPIEASAAAFAETLENGRNIFLFGTGHSHMLAEELFYRAGGLVNIRPVLDSALMLHESASRSTKMERLLGYAQILFDDYGMKAGDLIVIISNSGRNGVCVDLAQLAKEKGLKVIALTNLNHSKAAHSRHASGKSCMNLPISFLITAAAWETQVFPYGSLAETLQQPQQAPAPQY